jgi:hypothetical protein
VLHDALGSVDQILMHWPPRFGRGPIARRGQTLRHFPRSCEQFFHRLGTRSMPFDGDSHAEFFHPGGQEPMAPVHGVP